MSSLNYENWHSVCGIQWTVERPLPVPHLRKKTSPFFILFGKLVCFEFSVNAAGAGDLRNDYSLHLRSEESGRPYFSEDVEVCVHVTSSNDKVTVLALSSKMQLSTQNVYGRIEIWYYYEKQLIEKFENFPTEGRITFFVNFTKKTEKSSLLQLREQEPTRRNIGVDKCIQTSASVNTLPCLEKLGEDLSKLLGGEATQSDVVMTCGDQTAHAHSLLLCSRSPVLAAALNNDMAEKRSGRIEVRDMDPEIFNAFLRYLYTGVFPEMTVQIAMSLYEAGDRYAVKSLVKRCGLFLVENLSKENACEMLVMADSHNDEELKEKVISYILEEEIHLERDWSDFNKRHMSLANVVLLRFCKKFRKS